MANITRIMLDPGTVLSSAARDFINEARAEADLGTLSNATLFNPHKITYFRYKFYFLSNGDYTFTFKTCESVQDVSSSEDKLGWKYVYRLADSTQPILGVRTVPFETPPQVRGTGNPFLTQEQVDQRSQGIQDQSPIGDEDSLWHFNQLKDLLHTNYKVDDKNITIKINVNDEDLPIEVTTVMILGMARIIALSGASRLDLARELARKLRTAIVQCEKYREPKKSERSKTEQEVWIDDIIKITGGV